MRYPRTRVALTVGAVLAVATTILLAGSAGSAAAAPQYDISTLAGKVASVNGTAWLQIRFSAFLEEEAEDTAAPPVSTPITPTFVPGSPLDGNTILPPDVTVNQDTAGAPQNETAIAVNPNNPDQVVAAANDYVSRTWSCSINGTPCSALGDAYSGTYFSNDGGSTWCCTATDPQHLGTLIPGVEHLTGGQYDAGGDPSVAWDTQGHVFYAGLGFNRASAPNTVAVNRGTFDGSGNLSWSAPTFINQTTSPSTLNDKEWIAVDDNASSPFRDRIYVTLTRFLFNAHNGAYTQSPIFFASSSDGGATFTTPKSIAGNVLYSQGSRPVVGPDGSLYVFWDGSRRHDELDSTWVAKSTDGGATWEKPVQIAPLNETEDLANTLFRVNSYPAAAAAPNGDLYATWTTETADGSVAVWSKSTDGGQTWTSPARVFAPATRTPDRLSGFAALGRVAQRAVAGRAGGGRLPGGCDRARRAGRLQRLPRRRRLALADLRQLPAVAREQDQLPGIGRLRPQHPGRLLGHRRHPALQSSARIRSTPATASAAGSSATTPTSPTARTAPCTPSGPTRTTSRRSSGGSASSSCRRRSTRRTSPSGTAPSRTVDASGRPRASRARPAPIGPATIRPRTYGGDLASTWSIHPDELQAEVAGWPRKSTGKTQVRRTISHSLPRET